MKIINRMDNNERVLCLENKIHNLRLDNENTNIMLLVTTNFSLPCYSLRTDSRATILQVSEVLHSRLVTYYIQNPEIISLSGEMVTTLAVIVTRCLYDE